MGGVSGLLRDDASEQSVVSPITVGQQREPPIWPKMLGIYLSESRNVGFVDYVTTKRAQLSLGGMSGSAFAMAGGWT